MNFTTAVQAAFGKYATFSGRARRPEYWWFVLFVVGANIILNILDSMLFGGMHGFGYGGRGGEPLSTLFSLAVLLPSLAVAVRRLHDLDKSGWWLLLGLIPILGTLVLIYFFVQRGTSGPNRFGPEPSPHMP